VLDRLALARGLIRTDNGKEFRGKAMITGQCDGPGDCAEQPGKPNRLR
jgi:hypothetical protein